MADDLDEFLTWCAEHGHYVVKQLAENFRQYHKTVKEAKLDALETRVKADE